MKTKLKVKEVEDGHSGDVILSNGYIELTVPKRSKLLNGKKLKEGEVYSISLTKVNK